MMFEQDGSIDTASLLEEVLGLAPSTARFKIAKYHPDLEIRFLREGQMFNQGYKANRMNIYYDPQANTVVDLDIG